LYGGIKGQGFLGFLKDFYGRKIPKQGNRVKQNQD
jgi:hypothetical protein